MKIYLAADHAGYEMKQEIQMYLELNKDEIKEKLEKSGQVISNIEIVDFGAYNYDPNDDYPKFISVCAGALAGDIYTGIKNNLAIVFGGSGEGEAMVADKYKGVRAGVVNSENEEIVKLLREHNNANILSIGARFVSVDFAKEAVKTFILTKFDEGSEGETTRHERRIEEISEIEEKISDKVTKEEMEELSLLADMRKRVEDN